MATNTLILLIGKFAKRIKRVRDQIHFILARVKTMLPGHQNRPLQQIPYNYRRVLALRFVQQLGIQIHRLNQIAHVAPLVIKRVRRVPHRNGLQLCVEAFN